MSSCARYCPTDLSSEGVCRQQRHSRHPDLLRRVQGNIIEAVRLAVHDKTMSCYDDIAKLCLTEVQYWELLAAPPCYATAQ